MLGYIYIRRKKRNNTTKKTQKNTQAQKSRTRRRELTLLWTKIYGQVKQLYLLLIIQVNPARC